MVNLTTSLEARGFTESLKLQRIFFSIFPLAAYIAIFYPRFANRVFGYGPALNLVFPYLSFFVMTFLNHLLYQL
jgi:hypothetical protein